MIHSIVRQSGASPATSSELPGLGVAGATGAGTELDAPLLPDAPSGASEASASAADSPAGSRPSHHADQARLASLFSSVRDRWTFGLDATGDVGLERRRLPDVWARDLWSLGRAALRVLREWPEPNAELLELLVGIHDWITETTSQQSRVWKLARGPFAWAVAAAVARASQRVLHELACHALGSSPTQGRFQDPAGQLLFEFEDWVGCAATWQRSIDGWEGRLIEVCPGEILLWWASPSDRSARPGVLRSEPEEWGYAMRIWPATPEIVAQARAGLALERKLLDQGVSELVVPCWRSVKANREREPFLVDLRSISGITLENRLQTRWSGGDELLEPLDALVAMFKLAREGEQADLDIAFDPQQIVRWRTPPGAASEWRLRDLVSGALRPGGLREEPTAAVRMTRRCAQLVLRIWNSVGWIRHGTVGEGTHLCVTGRGRWVHLAPGTLTAADGLFTDLLCASSLAALARVGEGFQQLVQRWRAGELKPLASVSTLMVCPSRSLPPPLEGLPISPGRWPQVLSWAEQLLSVWSSYDSTTHGPEHLRAWMEAVPRAPGCRLQWIMNEPILLVKCLVQHRHTEAWVALRLQGSGFVPVFLKRRSDPSNTGAARRLHESCQFQNWLAEQYPGLTPQLLLLEWLPEHQQCVAVMPWVGASLVSASRHLHNLPLRKQLQQLVRWSAQLLNHLEVLQSLGIVHGDIKPDNIVVDSQSRLMLIDWELTPSPLACCPTQSDTDHSQWTAQSLYSIRVGQLSGTPPYMGEHAWTHGNGALDARADCYAVALSLLSLVSGVPAMLNRFHQTLHDYRGDQGLRSSIRSGLLHSAYQTFEISMRLAARAGIGKDSEALMWLQAMRALLATDFDEHGGVLEARKILEERYGLWLQPGVSDSSEEGSSSEPDATSEDLLKAPSDSHESLLHGELDPIQPQELEGLAAPIELAEAQVAELPGMVAVDQAPSGLERQTVERRASPGEEKADQQPARRCCPVL